MSNVIATIPKSKFKDWSTGERVARMSDGETWRDGKQWFWTIRMPRLPKKPVIGQVCFMIYDGKVRGYFDIVDVDLSTNWEWHKERHQTGFVLVMANWHPVANGEEYTGFQGWRYTHLKV